MANNLKISAVGLASLLAVAAFAQTATTNPVGFVKLTAPAGSDTILAAPLERASEFQGLVSSISGGVITVQGSPAWTANQFLYAAGTQPKTYFVRFASGARSGSFFTVTGNAAGTLTVDLNGDSLSAVMAGDQLTLRPYFTLGTLFPAADAGVSFETSVSGLVRKTEILFPSQNLVGINPSASSTYFFFNGAWRKVGAAIATSFDDTVLLPDAYMIVRNKTVPGTLTCVGSVLMSNVQIGLNSYGAAAQDNIVAVSRPVDVTLNASGLISSGAFVPSASALLRKDELFVFDNTVVATNKSAAATYFYFNNGWRKVGQPVATDFGADTVFKAGTGVIIRKAANGSGAATVLWTNAATY